MLNIQATKHHREMMGIRVTYCMGLIKQTIAKKSNYLDVSGIFYEFFLMRLSLL